MDNLYNQAEKERKYYIFKFTFTGYIIMVFIMAVDHLLLGEKLFGNAGNVSVFIMNALFNLGILVSFNYLSPNWKDYLINFTSIASFGIYLTDTIYRHVVAYLNSGPELDPRVQPSMSLLLGVGVTLVSFQTTLSHYQHYVHIYFTLCIALVSYLIREFTLQGNILVVVCLFQFLVMDQNEKMKKLSVKIVLDSAKESQFYRNIIQSFLPLPVAFVSRGGGFIPNQRFIDIFQETEHFILKSFKLEHRVMSQRRISTFQTISESELEQLESLDEYLESLFEKHDSESTAWKPFKVYLSFVNSREVKQHFNCIIQETFTVDKKNNGFMLLFEQKDPMETQSQESLKMMNGLAQAAHDLKSPCNAILTLVQDSQSEEAKKIKRLCKYQQFLIESIVDSARTLNNKKKKERNEKVDLQKLMDECADLFSDQIEGRGIELKKDYALGQKNQFIFTKPNTLKRVIINLISNSVKFTQKGFIRLSIDSTCPSSSKISIEDSGSGMRPEQISKLFQKFETSGSASYENKEGMGLGLNICKELVSSKLEGCFLPVESQLDKGTKFTFVIKNFSHETTSIKSLRESSIGSEEIRMKFHHLPDEGVFNPSTFYPEIKTKFSNAERLAKKYKISIDDFAAVKVGIIDDDLFTIRHLKKLCEILQVNAPFVFFDGIVAVEHLSKLSADQQPSLIIVDMYLTSINGYEVSQKLRRTKEIGTFPYIVLSSANDDLEKQEEINEILMKPVKLNGILEVVLLAALRLRERK